MAKPPGRARQATPFALRLHGERVRGEFDTHVRRDPFTRLRRRPWREDPYPIYEQIRSRGAFNGTRLGNLAAVDKSACSQVLRSRRFGVQPEDSPHVVDDLDLSFLERNPPDHTRLRRVAAPASSPRHVADYRVTIERTVDLLLASAPPELDLVTHLAAPLPIAVIAAQLDIPDADAEVFSRYGRGIGSALGGARSPRQVQVQALVRADADLERNFTDLFDLRRRDPREDVISRLVAAEGDRISGKQLVPLCTLLLIAGFETTANALLDHLDQCQLLRADPGLAAAATNQTLRLDPPVRRTVRISFDDTELAGQTVRSGQIVHVLLGGANRDPAVFDRAPTFHIGRTDATEHLAFSSCTHHCLGRPLAELGGAIALQRLAEEMPRLPRAGTVRRRNTTLTRGPLRLPVAR